MLDNYVHNPNDSMTWSHGYKKVYQGENNMMVGTITGVTKQAHLSLTYNVYLLDHDTTVTGCKVASTQAGFNGVGEAQPLEEGTPVLVMFHQGMLQNGFIVGAFNTEGKYSDYYKKGNLQEPAKLLNSVPYNQVSGHPNRITQEDSYFKTVGGKTLVTPYTSPEHFTAKEDIVGNSPLPSSIEMRNQGGDIVNYTSGAHIIYSDSNILQVSAGSTEDKPGKLLKLAAMHSARADLLEGKASAIPASATSTPNNSNTKIDKKKTNSSSVGSAIKPGNTTTNTGTTTSPTPPVTPPATPPTTAISPTNKDVLNAFSNAGVKPIIVYPSATSASNMIFSNDYIVTQERKLADVYTQASKDYTSLIAARSAATATLPSEVSTTSTTGPEPTLNNYKPTIKEAPANTRNYGPRVKVDNTGKDISNIPLIVVIHETDGSASSVVNTFQSGDLALEVTYHDMVARDGTIYHLCPYDHKAFGAAPSAFKGVTVYTGQDAEHKHTPSVNNFAYQISLESPPEAQNPNNHLTSHSGYTQAQYNSLAYQIARVGVSEQYITYHKVVQTDNTRTDPVSFDEAKFLALLKAFPKTKDIKCGFPPVM